MLLQFGNNQTIVPQVDEIFQSLKKQRGVVNSGKPTLNLESRDCYVYKIDNEHIHQKVNQLLNCKKSSIQVMQYGVDQHFQVWHQDNSGRSNDYRKVSMSLLLNNNFQGGDLQFELDGKATSANLSNIGDYAIFDSFIRHRVTKVTQGIRKTLVCWGYG